VSLNPRLGFSFDPRSALGLDSRVTLDTLTQPRFTAAVARRSPVRLDSVVPRIMLRVMPLFRPRLPLVTIEPCLPGFANAPPTGPAWVHEIKHDGFRIIARRDGRKVRLISRNGKEMLEQDRIERRFDSLVAALEGGTGAWVHLALRGRKSKCPLLKL
jgi:hypothetical protein